MRTSFVAVVWTLAILTAGCSTYSPTLTPTSPSPVAVPPVAPVGASSTITIPIGASTLGNRAYNPGQIAVTIGDTLTWINTDAVAHTSTANGGWDSGRLGPGQQFSTTLRAAGTFSYRCSIHPDMVGTVVVR